MLIEDIFPVVRREAYTHSIEEETQGQISMCLVQEVT